MGLIANTFRPQNQTISAPIGGPALFTPGVGAGYQQTTRAYEGNEIVAAALNLLSSSASEPHIIGRRWRRNKREIRNHARALHMMGVQNRAGAWHADAALIRNGYFEDVDDHPLVKLLNNPNPYMSRGEFWTRVTLDYFLAGNAYILKARYEGGLLDGAVGELWPLRPDRVKPVPGDMSKGEPFIKEYEYTSNGGKRAIPARDIIHLKHPDPKNPYEGRTPLLALLPRVDIDAAMRRFLFTFYDRGGAGAGANLNIKGHATQEQKDDLRNRFRRMFSGGQFDVLVTAADDVTYTPFTLNRGLRDALPREIDAQNEARISMVLRIQGPILGLLISYDNASYASHRIAWQVFWDGTMIPLLSDFADVLNLSLVPEFGGIDEVMFDTSDIHALQEDTEALHDRARKNTAARYWTLEHAQLVTGTPIPGPDEHYILPDGSVVKVSELDTETEPVQAPEQLVARAMVQIAARAGRPRIEDDPEARADYDKALAFKVQFPSMTWAQIASRVNRSERQLREIRARFAEYEDDE